MSKAVPAVIVVVTLVIVVVIIISLISLVGYKVYENNQAPTGTGSSDTTTASDTPAPTPAPTQQAPESTPAQQAPVLTTQNYGVTLTNKFSYYSPSGSNYNLYLVCMQSPNGSYINSNDLNPFVNGTPIYIGIYSFWDTLVENIIKELGTSATIGSYTDLTGFTDPGYLATQYTITGLVNNSKISGQNTLIPLIKSTDKTDFATSSSACKSANCIYNVTLADMDYLDAVYVSGGVVIPPAVKAATSTALKAIGPYFPSYQTELSTSKLWTYIAKDLPNELISANYNEYGRPGLKYIYAARFLLLKVTRGSDLDNSLKNTGYYVNKNDWSSSPYIPAGSLVLTTSFFPPANAKT